jgi:hypothetical protein
MAIVKRALVRNSDGLIENMIKYDTVNGGSAPTGYSLLDIVASPGDTWNGSAVVPKTVVAVTHPLQTRYNGAANDAARIAILAEAVGLTP